MTEKAKRMQAFTIDYQCDECGKGWMRATGVMLTVDPPLYPHRCTDCGHEQNMDICYPHIEHREKA